MSRPGPMFSITDTTLQILSAPLRAPALGLLSPFCFFVRSAIVQQATNIMECIRMHHWLFTPAFAFVQLWASTRHRPREAVRRSCHSVRLQEFTSAIDATAANAAVHAATHVALVRVCVLRRGFKVLSRKRNSGCAQFKCQVWRSPFDEHKVHGR